MASELETQWIDEYLETGDAIAAVKKIFPNTGKDAHEPEKVIGSRSRQLKAKLAREIDSRSRELYGKDAPIMMKRLKDLALNSKSDAVSAKCCADWLSRAGHDANIVIEHKDNRTEQELIQKLGTLIDKLDDETINNLPENVRAKLRVVA